MKRTSPLAAITAAAALALCAATPASAQTGNPDSGWQFEVTPYFWFTALQGDTKINNLPKLNVDMSFSDIWDMLDFALMGSFEARKGRWGVFFDAFYAKMSSSGGTTASLHGGPGVRVGADIDLKNTILTAAVQYRAIEGTTPVDVFVGARYNDVDIDTTVSANFFGVLSITRSPSYNKSWVDPYVGVRVMHPVAARWTLVGYGDYGGFGIGSDNTWQALGGVRFEINKTFTATAGYRYLHIDYNNDGFLYDMDYKGGYIGLGIKF